MAGSSSTTIVLITGANSGVGYAITEVLTSAAQPYHVIMAGRSAAKLDKAESEIKAKKETHEGSTSTLVLDVTDEASISAAAAEVSKRFGRVDVLINNAGIVSTASTLAQKLDETFRANVYGPVLVTEAFRPLISKSASACVIQVSSGLGSLSEAATPGSHSYEVKTDQYRMSKAALNMYVVELEKELRGKGVRVFGLCPGLVRSNLRGTDETAISAGGRAMDPILSGKLTLDVIEGRRDAEIGKVVKFEGTWDW